MTQELKKESQTKNDTQAIPDTSGRLKQWIVQIVWLVLGMILFYLDQSNVLKNEIPPWVYLIFITGFSAGYQINRAVDLIIKALIKKLSGG